MIKFLLKFFKKYILPKHKFNKGDLIYKEGTRTLYEVDENYFNTDMDAITIVRPYPLGKQVFGVDKHDIQEFHEYKKPLQAGYATTETDIGISSHDNLNFGRKK